jgi:cellulose 1,4-beta-cellobiosidase
MKFINGLANSDGWNKTSDPPIGRKGICCAEMDIWEANSRSAAYTPHPCSVKGAFACEGKECGDNEKNERYEGVCDKDGCDFNSYRMGDKGFFGRHEEFAVDSTKDLTIVTQFVTNDGTDFGDLVDIKRFYVQDGRKIQNSESSMAGVSGSSVSDDFCDAMKTAFGDVNDFKRKGGLKAMGDALDRGMVLVMSLWDDSQSNMLWLDSNYPLNKDPSTPGVARGPCKATSGSPAHVRDKYPTASVEYKDIMVGPIGTTARQSSGTSSRDDEFGDDRRLQEVDEVHV